MRQFTSWHVRYHAGRVQAVAFYAGALFAVVFIGFAITGLEQYAMTAAILDALALGISIGAWIVSVKFRD